MKFTRWVFAVQAAISFGAAAYVLMSGGEPWLATMNVGFGVVGAYNALREDA